MAKRFPSKGGAAPNSVTLVTLHRRTTGTLQTDHSHLVVKGQEPEAGPEIWPHAVRDDDEPWDDAIPDDDAPDAPALD